MNLNALPVKQEIVQDDFLLYSGWKQSQWLINIAHDICDPALKCGFAPSVGCSWRDVKEEGSSGIDVSQEESQSHGPSDHINLSPMMPKLLFP